MDLNIELFCNMVLVDNREGEATDLFRVIIQAHGREIHY
jgi:hypothetical protein